MPHNNGTKTDKDSTSAGGVVGDNCIFINEFSEAGVKNLKADLDNIRKTNQPIIPIYIDSFGGEVYSLLAMLDLLEQVDRPVATVCLGKAMSAGTIFLASGTKGLRFAGRHATIMMHDVGSLSFGKIEELKSSTNEVERLNSLVYRILDEKCGKKSGFFKKLVDDRKHADWFLTPKDAVKCGIIDYIGIPSLELNYSFEMRQKSASKVSLRKK